MPCACMVQNILEIFNICTLLVVHLYARKDFNLL